MSIFSRYALTDRGRKLIAKCETAKTNIAFTRAGVGSGVWGTSESLEGAIKLKSEQRSYPFSGISVSGGNEANVQLTVIMHNKGMKTLVYVMEMGIYATDPDLGEILYAILAADNKIIYLPAENGVGLSQITERVNLEVFNASSVTVEMAGALVSATDFAALKVSVDMFLEKLSGGLAGQTLGKTSDKDYAVAWSDKVITAKYDAFPETGNENALYIDTASSEFYIWTDGAYFKLPVGSEASSTLQKQITENKESIEEAQEDIKSLEARFTETAVTVTAGAWTAGTEDGITVYTQEISVTGMTAETSAQVWPRVISTGASGIVEEKKAMSVFFANGRAFSEAGKLVLKCYKKEPGYTFGLTVIGGLS